MIRRGMSLFTRILLILCISPRFCGGFRLCMPRVLIPTRGQCPGMMHRISRSLAPQSTSLLAGRVEDNKTNAQIARLNAVAAKLRAEASELEADQRNTMVEALTSAFQKCLRDGAGRTSVRELKASLTTILSRTLDEDQASKIVHLVNGDDKNEAAADFYNLEEFRKRLDRVLQDEKDSAFLAQREATAARLAAQKADAVAELVDHRAPSASDRLLAALPYLLPLFDALAVTAPLLGETADGATSSVVASLAKGYRSVPFSGLFAFLALSTLTSSLRLHRLVRFSLQQALWLDAVLVLPAVASSLSGAALQFVGLPMPEAFTGVMGAVLPMVALAVCLYGVVWALAGVEADSIPFMSAKVKARIPTTRELQAMFDADGNFKPPPPKGGLVLV